MDLKACRALDAASRNAVVSIALRQQVELRRSKVVEKCMPVYKGFHLQFLRIYHHYDLFSSKT